MLFNILPSMYSSLLPPHNDGVLDEMAKSGTFPSLDGLIPAIGYTILFGVLRIVLTHIAFKPLAVFAMKLKVVPFKKNGDVETYMIETSCKNGLMRSDDVKVMASKLEMPIEAAHEYLWYRRRDATTKKKITKFVEAIWRFAFYAYFCYLGYIALFSKGVAEWITDTEKHWVDWPNQPLDQAILFYYQIELGSYIHQAMWTEIHRSDAAEMLLHHFATILLIMMSYLTSFTRIGASILLVHDFADIFLESGKCFVYTSKAKGQEWMSIICDTIFAIFAIAFFITRLIIYPRYLVYSLVVEAPKIMGMWNGYYAFAGLLIVLQCLHIFWFFLICRMIVKLITTGIEKDERSDDDEGHEDDYDSSKSLMDESEGSAVDKKKR